MNPDRFSPNISTNLLSPRSISSKELSTWAPTTGSPHAFMLYKRNALAAEHQQRLIDARNAKLPSAIAHDDSINSLLSTSTPATGSSGEVVDIVKVSKKITTDQEGPHQGTQLKNESRNRRRAEHTKAVIQDLCEIVTDLFDAESKLLNPSLYGVESANQRAKVLRDVTGFVSSLPPRYAMNIDTPSEVLLHMRLVAAVRSDRSRAVVHVSRAEDGEVRQSASRQPTQIVESPEDSRRARHLVTISCADANGLLEFMTKLLATGGSHVVDADVMISSEKIMLVSRKFT